MGSRSTRGGRLPLLDWVMVSLPSYDPKSPKFVPPAFDVVHVSAEYVLYTRRSAAPVCTPPGWGDALWF